MIMDLVEQVLILMISSECSSEEAEAWEEWVEETHSSKAEVAMVDKTSHIHLDDNTSP